MSTCAGSTWTRDCQNTIRQLCDGHSLLQGGSSNMFLFARLARKAYATKSDVHGPNTTPHQERGGIAPVLGFGVAESTAP